MKISKQLVNALRRAGDYIYNQNEEYKYYNPANCNVGLLVKFLFPEYYDDEKRELILGNHPKMHYWSDHFDENIKNREFKCPLTGFDLNVIYKKLVVEHDFTIKDFENIEYFLDEDFIGDRSHLNIEDVINYFYHLANKLEKEINILNSRI